jgi:oligoribonuclease NrnB/cAMP/cGMP phosphodiesterase (DHH superfamily)
MFCLHHNDLNGRCSGAIVKRFFGDFVELYEIDYGFPVPWDKIEAAETVVMVDFFLSQEDMLKIFQAKGSEFIWIDHLAPGEEMTELVDVAGARDTEKTSSVLTWEYFSPEHDVPATVRFIGDHEGWDFVYPQTLAFCEGLTYADTNPVNDDIWSPLLAGDETFIQEFIDRGEILLDARWEWITRWITISGFEMNFEGYKTMAVNLPSSADVGRYICDLGYDIAYVYSDIWLNGEVMTKVTLYSNTVDVSRLAHLYDGGGHNYMAGFRFVRTGNSPFPSKIAKTE